MELFTKKEILHNFPYEGLSVTVDKTTTGTETVDGRKILRAGTILVGAGGSNLKDRKRKVKKATDETAADGILLHDVDVTDEDAVVSMIIKGTVRADRVAGYTDALDALLPNITFIKGV